VIEVEPGRLTARGAATRARIVDAAADLMYARGALRTSLDEVMAASRTSKSQLYHYFHDKDALVRAVIVRQTERVLDGQEPLPVRPRLDGWPPPLVHHDHRCAITAQWRGPLASELSDTSERRAPAARRQLPEMGARLATGLTAMQHSGELREDARPTDLASVIMAALQGGLLLTQTTRETRHLQLSLDMALNDVIHHLTIM